MCKRYLTGFPPLLHLLDSINVRKTEVLHHPASGTPYTAPQQIIVGSNPIGVFRVRTTTRTIMEQTQHQGCDKIQGLPCYHPVRSSVQFRDIHAVETSYSAIVTDTHRPLTSHPRIQVVKPSDQLRSTTNYLDRPRCTDE